MLKNIIVILGSNEPINDYYVDQFVIIDEDFAEEIVIKSPEKLGGSSLPTSAILAIYEAYSNRNLDPIVNLCLATNLPGSHLNSINDIIYYIERYLPQLKHLIIELEKILLFN